MRSLYIPHIADHPHGANIDPRDLALQVVDIVTLRPEIELCYMGIGGKCFEILESKPNSAPLSNFDLQTGNAYDANDGIGGNGGYAPLAEGDMTEDEDDMDGDMDDEEDIPEVDEDDDLDTGEVWDDSDDDDDFELEMAGSRRLRLRLREILFYDDKVSSSSTLLQSLLTIPGCCIQSAPWKTLKVVLCTSFAS